MLKCMNCNREYNEEFKFCPNCGSKLKNPKGVSMFSKLAEEYKDTYGTWEVTTEGDCEGRSTTNLGTFVGHIDNIALFLVNKCYYSLRFSKVENPKDIKLAENKDKVNVTLDVRSQTWDMESKDRVATMKELFKDRPVEIRDGDSYKSFVIARNTKHKNY